jgi:light-regulated signal transduction histidine kinase (bacteriophytochrome)
VLLEDHSERLNDEGRRVLGVIQRNVAKMGRLIDELLQFSRLSRRELDRLRIDTTALVREVVDETLGHERDRRFDVCIDPLPDASGDPLLLRQVWVNLIDNAVKYTRGRDPASIRITGATDGHWLTYSVADDGVGFDMAYADKLFGVFQRLHRESEFAGTGVGLALVQRIVARHEGQIHGHGTPGAGATFTFRLPKEQNS